MTKDGKVLGISRGTNTRLDFPAAGYVVKAVKDINDQALFGLVNQWLDSLSTQEKDKVYDMYCRGKNIIIGDRSVVLGSDNRLRGMENTLSGASNVVIGDNNKVSGDSNNINRGNDNSIQGSKNSIVAGNNNRFRSSHWQTSAVCFPGIRRSAQSR
jgi:hypothetical protein